MQKRYKIPLILLGVTATIAVAIIIINKKSSSELTSQTSLIDKMTRDELIDLLVRKSGLDKAQVILMSDAQLKEQLKKMA